MDTDKTTPDFSRKPVFISVHLWLKREKRKGLIAGLAADARQDWKSLYHKVFSEIRVKGGGTIKEAEQKTEKTPKELSAWKSCHKLETELRCGERTFELRKLAIQAAIARLRVCGWARSGA